MSESQEEMSSAPYLREEGGNTEPTYEHEQTAAWVSQANGGGGGGGGGGKAAAVDKDGGLEQGFLSETEDGLESVIDEPIAVHDLDGMEDVEGGIKSHSVSRIEANTNIYKSAFHIFKGNVGTGVFLLPTIYNDAGYIAGPIIALCCGAMVVDATMMLLRAKKKIGRDEVQSYPQVVAFVFGNVFRMIINASIVATQFGFCMMYLQFAAGLIQSLHDYTGAYKIYCIAGTVLVFPMTMMSNNMSLLAIASGIASFCVFFCVISTMGETGSKLSSGVAVDKVVAVESPVRWVLYIASSMSVLEGIALVLPVENACKDKDKVPKMIKGVLSGIICLYLAYGMVGYLAYGSSLKVSVVNVLELNPFTVIIRIALAVNLLCTYPLQFVPAIQIIDQALRIDKSKASKSSRAIVARVIVNLCVMCTAMLIGPETVGLILAFIGSIAATLLAVILPALLELQTDFAISTKKRRSGWDYYKRIFTSKPTCSFIKFRCYLYIAVGLITMVAGTITCLFDAAELGHHKNGKSLHHLVNNTKPVELLMDGL